MALETWLMKVKSAISHKLDTARSPIPKPKSIVVKKTNIGVLAFEIAGLMSKLLHLWSSLSDKNIVRLRNESISIEGVRKIVSNDEFFLLGLACAEMTENVRLVAKTLSRICRRCQDPNLRDFERIFNEFANSGRDLHGWLQNAKEMEAKNKKMDRYVTITVTLSKEMEELSSIESSFKKAVQCKEHESAIKEQKIMDLQQKLFWQRQEVKYLKERSLWNRSFDTAVSILARSVFTVLARIKVVFGISSHGYHALPYLPRSLSASAMVHPTENPNSCTFVSGPLKSSKLDGNQEMGNPKFSTFASEPLKSSNLDRNQEMGNAKFCNFASGPLKSSNLDQNQEMGNPKFCNFGSGSLKSMNLDEKKEVGGGAKFFDSNSKLLKPPESTLGAAALSLHYANLIIVMEKMIKSPQLVGIDARDDLYSMLPSSIRAALRGRLRGVGFTASDPALAGEWRTALGRILAWLAPLAHNMIKWQSERSFEQQNLVPKTNVLLLQTLFFANKEKTEAAITEMLVGLNYIWRFEREMTAKALFECNNFVGGNVSNVQSLS